MRTAHLQIQLERDTPHRRCGFTLVELLVVIGIIVLLIGLLLPALANVRKTAKVTQSTNLMKNLGDAADSFFLAVQRYPGVIGEQQFCGDDANYEELSGTENALLDLMGGLEKIGADNFNLAGKDIYRQDIGRGPKIDGKQHAAFFQPSPEDLYYVNGQLGQSNVEDNLPEEGDRAFPDLVDAFGTPIIFWRHSGQKPRGLRQDDQIVTFEPDAGAGEFAPYYMSSFQSYSDSTGLVAGRGRASTDQQAKSLLSQTGSDPSDVLMLSQQIVAHPSLPGTARGRYVIITAGPDQIYFDRATIENTGVQLDDSDVLERFDDRIMYGGG